MKEELLYLLSENLELDNFKLSKKDGEIFFLKKEENRYLQFNLTFFGKTHVSCEYGIHFQIIEEIIDEFYEREKTLINPTIFINTGSLLVDTDLYKFNIETNDNVKKAYLKILELYNKYASPYYEKYNTLESLNHLLNEIPYNPSKVRNKFYHNETLHGFFRGALVIKLLDIDGFSELFKVQLTFLEESNYSKKNIKHYFKFIGFLDEYFD